MNVCSNPPVHFNPDLAAETIEVHCRRCRRPADRARAVVLRPELLVQLRVECHGFAYQRDFAELYSGEPLRVEFDPDARLCIVDREGIVHASHLRVDVPRMKLQGAVMSLCGTSGLVVGDRGLTCLECFRRRRGLK